MIKTGKGRGVTERVAASSGNTTELARDAAGPKAELSPGVEHERLPASFYRSIDLRYWLGAAGLGALLWILVLRLF